MSMTPIIAVHMTAALAATALGPLALWARLGRAQRPRLHRAFGYAWVTLMLLTAFSAIFIKSAVGPSVYGFGPIHLLIPITIGGLIYAFWRLARREFASHKRAMLQLYISACIVAGGFTLLPGRFLGDLIWRQWLGLA